MVPIFSLLFFFRGCNISSYLTSFPLLPELSLLLDTFFFPVAILTSVLNVGSFGGWVLLISGFHCMSHLLAHIFIR